MFCASLRDVRAYMLARLDMKLYIVKQKAPNRTVHDIVVKSVLFVNSIVYRPLACRLQWASYRGN